MDKPILSSKEYKYKFTLICAVYNVENYIEETLESFISQDIGFIENVQVVLVNDGSKDGSGAICDKYALRYPDNIKVIHKANGGVSSARNIGLQNIEGKYYNFCDPDDLLTRNTLSSVWKFFEEHEDEIDIATIPMHFFEAYTGVPYHNSKFEKGTRVIDLMAEPYAPLFSSSSSFIHSRMKDKFTFDTRLKFAEDSKYIQHILLEKLALGVVADCKYMYRRRVANTSAINSSQNKDEWYFDTLEHSFWDTMQYAKEKYGYIPQFIQHTFLCDFKWRLTQAREDNKYIDKDEETYNKYFALLSRCINEIDVDVVMSNQFYNAQLMLLVLKDIQKRDLTIRNLRGVDCYFFGRKWLFDLSRLFEAEFDIFEPKGDHADLYFSISGPSTIEKYEFCLEVNGQRCFASLLKSESAYNLHINSGIKRYYKVSIPLKDKENYFSLKMCDKATNRLSMVEVNKFGRFFPLNTVPTSYFSFGRYVMRRSDKQVFLIKRASRIRKLAYELKYCRSLLKVKNPKGTKIIAYRWLYFVGRLFSFKKKWLLMDRINKADDNAEALFDYMNKKGRRKAKARFAVADGGELKRLKKRYRGVIKYNTRRFYLNYVLSDVIISSHVDDFIMRPLLWKQVYIKDISAKKKFVFLQHGVTQNDISNYLNKFSKNIYGITVVSDIERENISRTEYMYEDSNIWLSGFARFDRLYDATEKVVTIMPTWRSYLAAGMDNETGIWKLYDDFKDSSFYTFYNNLLNDERLIEAAQRSGYSLQFMPHPILAPHIDLFDKNENVEFLDPLTSYREIYARSALVLTDYSSAVFDFAYLRKPVLYTQFDREEMQKRANTYSLNVDFYDKYAFGEIAFDYDTTVDLLIEYMENGCRVKDEYRKKIDDFFAYNDNNNCARIVERIVKSRD
ncbi:MAG: CDP-glycerol glycerophosphotransferase family protein [Clostridia bacterium]|nr:CDP-glycerol glycerophosphotransferase family protein [Clostridia bacterium]